MNSLRADVSFFLFFSARRLYSEPIENACIDFYSFYQEQNETLICLHGGGVTQVGKVTRPGEVTAYRIAYPYFLSFYLDHIYMIGGVTARSLG